MTNWANATLAAWFGAQNCYLDMAAMRPDPPSLRATGRGLGHDLLGGRS
jgi:hypothetical protein